MVYIIDFKIDGDYGNTFGGFTGVAAAIRIFPRGRIRSYVKDLPFTPRRIKHRAELVAVIAALDAAFSEMKTLKNDPKVEVSIRSDSRFMIILMNKWLRKWWNHRWSNSFGNDPENWWLLETAYRLDQKLKKYAKVRYVHISSEENDVAALSCRRVMLRGRY